MRIARQFAVSWLALLACAEADGHQARPEPRDAVPEDRMALRVLSAARGADPVLCSLAAIGLENGRHGSGGDVPGAPGRFPGLALSSGDPDALPAVAWALAPIADPGAVEPLGAALREADGCVRLMAVVLLGRAQNPAALRPLLEALSDSDPAVRAAGALGLGLAGDPVTVPPLIEKLQEDDDPDVRQAAAWALGRIE